MHDHRRSNVSIENTSAITAVCALGQRLCVDGPALRAGLGSAARIDQDELDPGACSLVVEHRGQLCPRSIVDVLGEHPARHAFDVEIFNRDTTEAVDQVATDLMQHVAPTVGDARLISRQCGLALASDVRSTLAPRQRSLAPSEALGSFLGPAGPVYRFAIGQGHKRCKTKVKANAIRSRTVDDFNLDGEHHVPLASLPSEDCSLWLGRQFAVPLHLDFAGYAHDGELARLAKRQTIANAEISGLVSGGCAEPRKARLLASLDPLKERLERLVQLAQNLLLGRVGPARKLWRCASRCLQFVGLVDVSEILATTAIGFNALLQTGIVKSAEVAQHRIKRSGLRHARIDAVFVAALHSLAFLRFDVFANRCLGHGADCSGEVGPRPQCRQTRPQQREFLPQHARRMTFEAVDDLGNVLRRTSLNKQMHMIRHHFHCVNREAVLLGDLANQLFQPRINRRRQRFAPVLRAPDQVVLQAEHCASVFGVSISRHAFLCIRRMSNVNRKCFRLRVGVGFRRHAQANAHSAAA